MAPGSDVLVVASKFAPHVGGTAVVWSQWVQHWPSDGLTVIAPKSPGWREFDASRAYQVVRCGYPDIPKLRMPWLWAVQASQLMARCLRRRPKFIHLSHVFENGFMGPILLQSLGIPYFVHTYGEELMFALRYPWLRRLVGTVLSRAAGVTTISRFTRSLHLKFGFTGEPLLVHPGVDVERFAPCEEEPVARRLGIPPGPMLLTTGRLMDRKGHARVLNMLPQLLKRFPDLRYVVAGTGPHASSLRELADRQGVARHVDFLGRVDDELLPSLMREATVFVHPNFVTEAGDVEGFGIVFLEAAAAGVPVIGGRSGGVPDAVDDGTNGYLVETDRELFDCTIRILEQPQLRAQMGLCGIAWSERFRWDSAARAVWEFSLGRTSQKGISSGQAESPCNQ